MQIDAATLNNAIRSVRSANGTQRFELQSLLVFCVAESIRSDLIASRIGPPSAHHSGGCLARRRASRWAACLLRRTPGGNLAMPSGRPRTRRALDVQQTACQRTAAEQTAERIDETRIDAALRLTARGVKRCSSGRVDAASKRLTAAKHVCGRPVRGRYP